MLAKLTQLVIIGGLLSLGVTGCGTTAGNPATSSSAKSLSADRAFSTSNAASPLGTNTNEILESDASVPFIDLMRAAMPFQEASPWLTKGNVTYDSDGWPVNLNGGQAGTRFLSNLPAAVIPEGTYTVLYDGEGEIQYLNDAALIERKVGYDTITLAAGNDGIFNASLLILRSNPQNYVRNIRILPPGGICSSNSFQRVASASGCGGDFKSFVEHANSIVFNPDFMAFMKDFRAIRFMNMSGVTRSTERTWADRNQLNKATWGGKEGSRGAPVEIQVELANRLNADPWFTLPHGADDNYVRQYATYVKQHLNSNLKPHIEYSNETWNTIFTQGNHMIDMGLKLGLDTHAQRAGHRYYSQRSVEIFKIWEEVFGGTQRLVRILSGWTINDKLTETVLSHKDAYKHADAFAVGPYVFGGHAEVRTIKSVDDALGLITNPVYRYSHDKVMGYIRMQKAITDKYGIQLMAYEAGQGLVDFHTKTDDEFPNPLLFAANRDPRMRGIYDRFLNGWKAEGGTLMMHYTAPRTFTKHGPWGTKEYITQPLSQAPKYQALLDFIRSTPCWWNDCKR
ncbi:hypothetical protein SAMN05660964_00928 [Thiothrix caldifontis]|uniref:Uncharacterized protein n=2 Tax=Thiothrix caldifontis TaxID=525918 RepID=A0A1H3YGZ7_9GAMM|nr:hypothetical protein SAMN05660964_00928 [Thiothrix caldifontis]